MPGTKPTVSGTKKINSDNMTKKSAYGNRHDQSSKAIKKNWFDKEMFCFSLYQWLTQYEVHVILEPETSTR